MRFLGLIPVIFMVALLGYGLWDLSVNGVKPLVPADEYAQDSQEITDALAPFQKSLETELSSAVLPRLEDTLALIENEYGATSPELLQAKSDTALMLNNSRRTDLALPYMRSAVEISRAIFGDVHRETALVLNDLAVLEIENTPTKTSAKAVDLLRESIAIREKTIGSDHAETIGARIGMADQLFLLWKEEDGAANHPFLLEASENLDKALMVSRDTLDSAGEQSELGAKILRAKVTHAQENDEKAATYFADALPAVTQETEPALFVIFADSYNEYATSLRSIGRAKEADYMIGFINLALKSPEQLDLYVATEGGTKELAPEAQDAPATDSAPVASDIEAAPPQSSE